MKPRRLRSDPESATSANDSSIMDQEQDAFDQISSPRTVKASNSSSSSNNFIKTIFYALTLLSVIVTAVIYTSSLNASTSKALADNSQVQAASIKQLISQIGDLKTQLDSAKLADKTQAQTESMKQLRNEIAVLKSELNAVNLADKTQAQSENVKQLKREIEDLKNHITKAKLDEKARVQEESVKLLRAEIADLKTQIYTNNVDHQNSFNKLEAKLTQADTELQQINQKTLVTAAPAQGDPNCPPMDFLEVARKSGTDKVTTHEYHRSYAKYFTPIRCQPLRILEIGLGCTMSYGPGASYNLWLEFFPNAQIYFIEYDRVCGEKWANKNDRVHMFIGDQADTFFLNDLIQKSGGNFDFIIDDGGHTMRQQQVSFETLFPAVKVGGMYFIEDLLSSFWNGPNFGGPGAPPGTTVAYVKDIIEDLAARKEHTQGLKRQISNMISTMECIDELCSFTRK